MMLKEKTDILIFSASYGGGHRRVSYAVERAISSINKDIKTKIVDLFAHLSPAINNFNSYLYVTTMRKAPFLYGGLYNISYDLPLNNFLNRMTGKIGLEKLLEVINELNPKVILSTYPTYGGMISELKKRGEINVVSTVVITDFVAHSQWIYPLVDQYFVSSDEVKYHLIKKGIFPETIKITGIPINSDFLMPINRAEVLKKYGLKDGITTIFVMAGMFGMTRGVEEICSVVKDISIEIQTVILCGNDEKLFQNIMNMCSNNSNIKPILGLGEVHELMDISSLLISKSGGITVSESLAKELPMLVYRPLSGQEYYNAMFLSNTGAGIIVEDEDELRNILKHILVNNACLQKMKESARVIKKPEAAIDIARSLIENITLH